MEGKMHPPTSVASRKRQNLTLDLDSAVSPARRSKMSNLLTSPDVQMLKLTSPDVEKFLIQNPSLATPTPSGYNFPNSVTEEQIMYAKGFEDALEQVKQADSSQSEAATTLAGLSSVVVNHYGGGGHHPPPPPPPPPHHHLQPPPLLHADPHSIPVSVPVDTKPSVSPLSAMGDDSIPGPSTSDHIQVKEEPDDSSCQNLDSVSPVPSSAGMSDSMLGDSNMSPIDMESQEMIKLERKRMRNRMAASKCRKKKLERIAQLDERVKQLKAENADLAAVVKKMKTSVAQLKQEVIEHVNSGCEIRVADTSFASTS